MTKLHSRSAWENWFHKKPYNGEIGTGDSKFVSSNHISDTQRLDFLNSGEISMAKFGDGWNIWLTGDTKVCTINKDIRAATDEAMRKFQ